MIARFVSLAIRWRNGLFLIAALSVVLAFGPSLRLQFDRRIESMFRLDDPHYQTYLELKRSFGGLETSLVAYDDDQLFSLAGLQRLHRLRLELLDVPGVRGVLCLDNSRRPSAPLDSRLLVEQLQAGAVTADALRQEILKCSLYRGRLISESGNTAVLWVELVPTNEQPQGRGDTIDAIRRICDAHDRPAVFAGGPVLVDDVFTYLERDGWTLGLTSSLILTLVIAGLFRSIRWIVLPLAVVQLTLLWTKAILSVSGMQLSMVSSPLVALVTVIGVATVVHVAVRFREERLRGDSMAALRATLIGVGPAIFWTCLTTVAGFGALMASSVAPVRSFGLMMALGVGLVFVATLALTPATVLTFPAVGNLPGRALGERWLASLLQFAVSSVERYPRRVLLVVIALLAVTLVGISRLQVATDFNDNFRKSSSIVRSFDFLIQRLPGINTLDILVDTPRIWGRDFEEQLARLRAMQNELEGDPVVADTVSVVDLLDFVQPGSSGREPVEPPSRMIRDWLAELPNAVPQRATLAVLDFLEPRMISGFWNRESRMLRVIVQAGHAEGAAAKRELVERIDATAQRYFPQARTTGIYVMMVYLVQSLLGDQWMSFAISITAILLMMAIAFWNWRWGVIALIPNVAPIVMVLGTMGWLGLKINMATAMLASVSLGLSVDSSIHYLYRFKFERRAGRSVQKALAAAHGSVGLAMVLANLALVAGFLALLLSSLIPTIHFGLLVSVAMLGGLVGNLLVLPLLLRFLERDSKGADTA